MQKKLTHLLEIEINQFMEHLEIKPESVVLFGSFARGNQTESSDIDLLVVLKSDLDWFDRQLLVDRADAFVYTPKELEKMFDENNGFILDVLEDSIVLQDNGYWKAMEKRFLDKKNSGMIERIKNGWKICKAE